MANYKILVTASNGAMKYYQDTATMKDYVTTSIAELQEKYVELLKSYSSNQLDCIADLSEVISVAISEPTE